MKHALYIFSCAFLLSGCTDSDWNHLLGFSEPAQPQQSASQAVNSSQATTTASPQPATNEAPNNSFCRDVATEDATSNDFDAPTQQRVFAQSYAQCLAIYSR